MCVLQCAIPVFDGLLPEPHNTTILSLLYTCGEWHGLAKLRMHTDSTLKLLDNETILMGTRLRYFANTTCEVFDTKELKQEVAARNRRQGKNKNPQQTPSSNIDYTPGARQKKYHLRTIKHHFLGDNVNHIRRFGTTDSISTEPVCFFTFKAYVFPTKVFNSAGRARTQNTQKSIYSHQREDICDANDSDRAPRGSTSKNPCKIV